MHPYGRAHLRLPIDFTASYQVRCNFTIAACCGPSFFEGTQVKKFSSPNGHTSNGKQLIANLKPGQL
jgi:hypothetical protein